jgi:hypothetical protein
MIHYAENRKQSLIARVAKITKNAEILTSVKSLQWNQDPDRENVVP